ncbi:MAG TPA: hypothetical protein VLN72_09110 [Gillisia sp.]|nr:hypothetical protein [Gillisia sp.]
MKYFTILLIFLNSLAGYSQKDTSLLYDAGEIKKLYIITEEVFKINIKTGDTDKITLSTHSEGEYYNDISLEMVVEQDKMILSSKFPSRLQGGYDKLSSQKVFSMEITLEIPEGLEVYVKSNMGSLMGSGSYKYLEAELRTGNCELENFTGNALINTYSGRTEVETSNATITASSRSGKVSLPFNLSGPNKIEIRSISGDIRVREN